MKRDGAGGGGGVEFDKSVLDSGGLIGQWLTVGVLQCCECSEISHLMGTTW